MKLSSSAEATTNSSNSPRHTTLTMASRPQPNTSCNPTSPSESNENLATVSPGFLHQAGLHLTQMKGSHGKTNNNKFLQQATANTTTDIVNGTRNFTNSVTTITPASPFPLSPRHNNNTAFGGPFSPQGQSAQVASESSILSSSLSDNHFKNNMSGSHDNHSESSFSRERNEDDPISVVVQQQKLRSSGSISQKEASQQIITMRPKTKPPTNESAFTRGATPPRPISNSHGTTRSNDGIVLTTTTAAAAAVTTSPTLNDNHVAPTTPSQRRASRHSRRSASPNRIPRVPIKAASTSAIHCSPTNAIVNNNNSSMDASQTPPRHRFANSKDHHQHQQQQHQSTPNLTSTNTNDSTQNNQYLQWTTTSTAGEVESLDYEQKLFEQRLCEDAYGVAVRKISQTGKPNLRYIKCLTIDPFDQDTIGDNRSRTSASSFTKRASFRKNSYTSSSSSPIISNNKTTSLKTQVSGELQQLNIRVLSWGKKKDVRLPLDRFVCVRKGKTTDRARRNASAPCRILSLVTTDANHPSLDIEAPTRLDRDKFARAFARFLDVPLVGEDSAQAQSVSSAPRSELPIYYSKKKTSAMSEPDLAQTPKQAIAEAKNTVKQQNQPHLAPFSFVQAGTEPPSTRPSTTTSLTKPTGDGAAMGTSGSPHSGAANFAKPFNDGTKVQISSLPASLRDSERSSTQAATASRPTDVANDNNDAAAHVGEDTSQVSSLTGAGLDQEIVEELHQALTELRQELEDSRAEAARAVKVAEQAIQSAENSNSNDWNSTVTHKAAEAAALAQKKSAEAMAKQRLAEEKLDGERRTGAFWRRQAEAAEEEAGALQTRAAAAEVQRAAMAEELECERRKAVALVESLKARYVTLDQHQKEALRAALERNRALELELDDTRRDLFVKHDEAKTLEEELSNNINNEAQKSSGSRMKLNIMGRKKKSNQAEEKSVSAKLLPGTARSSSDALVDLRDSASGNNTTMTEHVFRLQIEATEVRRSFELLRKATDDELNRLPEDAKLWAKQVSHTIADAQSEVSLLREKLALESAARRKLLHEVQDLRGVVRVYCRPRSAPPGTKGILSIPSQETLLLHPYQNESPMSFKFDRVFTPDVQQREVYNEIEELCLSVMDGYNICLMAHGQRGTGKTYSMLGDVIYSTDASENVSVVIQDFGIHLKAAQQLFSIAEHRNERYRDVFKLDIVEVYNERLIDLLAGTDLGETRGSVIMEDARSTSRRSKRGVSDDSGSLIQQSNSQSVSSKQGSTMTKLEIRTNHNGDTVVQGLLSVEVHDFDDVYKLWQDCLSHRATRLAELGIDLEDYDASSHVIATLTVASTNVSTGMGCLGKIKFVDLAGADLVQRRGGSISDPIKCATPDSSFDKSGTSNSNNDWKYSNRSLATLNDVVNCRSQYMRSVPYRNSTLTHLLSDNLEADTKVLLLLCVSAHPKDLHETACALRFASGMRRVTIGKATKHSITC